jgi:hypothetical protein
MRASSRACNCTGVAILAGVLTEHLAGRLQVGINMNPSRTILCGVAALLGFSPLGCAVQPGDDELIREFEQELAAKSVTFWHADPGDRTVEIPVCFSGGNGTERALVKSAAEEWSDLSSAYGAKFTGWEDCPFLPPFPYKISIASVLPPPTRSYRWKGGRVRDKWVHDDTLQECRQSN